MTELKFTDQEMQLLQMAIGEMPFKLASPLVQSINRQIMEAKVAAGATEVSEPETRPEN